MVTMPPVPMKPLVFSISSRTLALSVLFARCIASTRIIRPSYMWPPKVETGWPVLLS